MRSRRNFFFLLLCVIFNQNMASNTSRIQVKTPKKKVFITNRALFPPNFRPDVNPFKTLGGCRCGPFSNYWGDTAKLLGGIYPPRVSAPLLGSPLKTKTVTINFGILELICCSYSKSHCSTKYGFYSIGFEKIHFRVMTSSTIK